MKDENNFPALEYEFSITAEDAGQRLDLYLAGNLEDISRSRVQKLIEDGMLSVNENPCYDKNHRLQTGEFVKLILPPPEPAVPGPEKIRLDILFEDKDLVVINKPRGMVVHPAPGHSSGTLVNALLAHCDDLSGIGGVMRPGIVHRLDKDTSGLLLVAKNDVSHRFLSSQLKSRTLKREYIALVHGRVEPFKGKINAAVGRHPVHRKKMAVLAGGREAITRYRVLKCHRHYSLLKLQLETGRTHQIRVHLSYIGFPVVGDSLYSPHTVADLPPELRLVHALHAYRLNFIHPASGEQVGFTAPLPPDYKAALHYLALR